MDTKVIWGYIGSIRSAQGQQLARDYLAWLCGRSDEYPRHGDYKLSQKARQTIVFRLDRLAQE